MSVLISVPIGMTFSQYSNLNHACISSTLISRVQKLEVNDFGIVFMLQIMKTEELK